MVTERALRRRIYVELPELTEEGKTLHRKICIEPDVSVDFTIQRKWQDFFDIEVYRTLPPEEALHEQPDEGGRVFLSCQCKKP